MRHRNGHAFCYIVTVHEMNCSYHYRSTRTIQPLKMTEKRGKMERKSQAVRTMGPLSIQDSLSYIWLGCEVFCIMDFCGN